MLVLVNTEFAIALSKYPDRFRVLCGGGTLQPLIHQAVTRGGVSVTDFKNKAREVAGYEGR